MVQLESTSKTHRESYGVDRLGEPAAPCRCMMNEGVSCIHPASRAVSETVAPHALKPVSLTTVIMH